MKQALNFALVGSPNSGKTTLFNALTGMRAKTGNYPGVTVDRRVGSLNISDREIQITDLPGSYSLQAISEEEHVTTRFLRGELGDANLDGIVFVADATSLSRALPFLISILKLNIPTILVCTMIDECKARGGDIDFFKLKAELGIPVIGVVGNQGLGVTDLKHLLSAPQDWKTSQIPEIKSTEERFVWADKIFNKVLRHPVSESGLTRQIDRLLLHPVLGLIIFTAFISVFFQSIFTWAAPAMDLFSTWVNQFAYFCSNVLPPGMLNDLICDGIIQGVGAVLVFIPQIAVLFALIFFFEASGYMARAAFVVDRLMGWAGLEGRCFISLLSSYACAVPGIMATRSIPSPRDRLATILVAPFATCSARLPVYAILISAFVPNNELWGPFTLQGLVLMALYLLGGVSAIVFAAVFKRGLLRGASLPFFLELPPYRLPSLTTIVVQVFGRLKVFIRDAGRVILVGSIVLWFLLNFPQHQSDSELSGLQNKQQQIEQSYAADLGRSLEPIFAPLGFDWKINIGIIGSFAARELMISTMAQVYAVDNDPDDNSKFIDTISTPDPTTGKQPITFATAISMLVFFVYALLCLSTVAVVKRETNSWRWPAFMLGYMFATAWIASFIAYRIALA
ncbi:MAG: ferrous iron transporter B [Planctomycetes bacterium]|nr:ferrous iron transporter B [Planctomycetota bacterium]